jgi:hypothetical protein
MTTLFHSVITTQRHREHGYCEPSDFGKIDLIVLSPEEKELIVSFQKYSNDPKVEYIRHKGYAYRKIDTRGLTHFSKEEEGKWINKQGKFSENSALELVLEYRSRLDNSYSYAGSKSFILIGRTLYERYSKMKDLRITTCGNCMFSHWISIDIEAHGGKATYPLKKSSLEGVIKERRGYWESTKPKGIRGDGHSHFSYPNLVTWGENFKK